MLKILQSLGTKRKRVILVLIFFKGSVSIKMVEMLRSGGVELAS